MEQHLRHLGCGILECVFYDVCSPWSQLSAPVHSLLGIKSEPCKFKTSCPFSDKSLCVDFLKMTMLKLGSNITITPLSNPQFIFKFHFWFSVKSLTAIFFLIQNPQNSRGQVFLVSFHLKYFSVFLVLLNLDTFKRTSQLFCRTTLNLGMTGHEFLAGIK